MRRLVHHRRMEFPPTTSLASLPETVDRDELAAGLWRDDVLALGSRLRAVYGNAVTLDRDVGGYVVSCGGGVDVRVTCTTDPERPGVRAACALVELMSDSVGLWQFALRENARLRLARLGWEDGLLVVEYELPWFAACGKVLEAGVSAVAHAARGLRRELAD
jgi:hypothetical protein